jgi:hypothetical protein
MGGHATHALQTEAHSASRKYPRLFPASKPDLRRGRPRMAGYGQRFRRLRDQWGIRIRAGGVNCARCGEPIAPDAKWDLGHDDFDRSVIAGPEHRRCNRSTAGRFKVRGTSRRW